MTVRSFQASPEGIEKAKKTLIYYFLTQTELAEKELKASHQIVDKFFKGEPIESEYFYQICSRLDLEWEEIITKPPSESESVSSVKQDTGFDIDVLVQEVRTKSRASITMQCGKMRVLNMTQPIGLNDIYISVNILETIIGRRQMEITDLLSDCDPSEFKRWGLGKVTEKRVSGLRAVEKYSKLIVLGKPGIGKTTFLKYLAIHCSEYKLQADKVPIFITLKDFAEAENQPSLLLYITQLLHPCGVTDTQTSDLLNHGGVMILLDGLDEVRVEDSSRVVKQIRAFYDQFHSNQFVITCRIAGREYTFEQFTEVEIADFDVQQIVSFATKWFTAITSDKGNRFIQKLLENETIQELAICPLLLTLLCLVFEESGEFPMHLSQLYKEGLDVLLKKWDASRNIEREQVYKKLPIQQKEDLLGQIARVTFERGNYFFKRKELEQHIADYIRNLPGINADIEELQLDSQAVLKSLEAQHGLLVERARGIYSFSHLTFQEYFTAREIVVTSNPQALETALKQLVSQITEKRWREVFLLTVVMLRNADYLLQLMKQQTERLLTQDECLQTFLTWANQKSRAVTAPYKPVAVRAFYLAIAHTLILTSKLDLERALALARDSVEIAFTLDPTFILKPNYALDLCVDRHLTLALVHALALVRNITIDSARVLKPQLELVAKLSPPGESLLLLINQLPEPEPDQERFKQWWQANGGAWTEQLRAVIISERDIGHLWQFSDQQREALRQYYEANMLLVDCLKSDCYLTRAVREGLEETLFLLPAKNSWAQKTSCISG